MTRTIIERAVIIITPEDDADTVESIKKGLQDYGPVIEHVWNAQNPDEAHQILRNTLTGKDRAIVKVTSAYAKAIKLIISTARKKGYEPYVVNKAWGEFATQIEWPAEIIPMNLDRRQDNGPFTLIGDVHGCAEELMELLVQTGHARNGWEDLTPEQWHEALVTHPEGRKVILLGDLVDRGPRNLVTLKIAKALEEKGGLRVLGNHDSKMGRWLKGNKVNIGPHQKPTADDFIGMSDEEKAAWGEWMLDTEGHYILDGGKLVVAHAGMTEEHLGRKTDGAYSMALYGKPIEGGAVDEDGYPLAEDWALAYEGEATVVHGHVVYDEPRVTNDKVIALDTGCVFGGTLTALQWPEKTFVTVPARREWWSRRTHK